MADTRTPSYKAILKKYKSSQSDVQQYFELLPKLIEEFPYEVALAYLFLRTERAQNRALYGGVVKLHHADTELADKAVSAQHITRDHFHELFKNIFAQELKDQTAKMITKAEEIRDIVIHGKDVSDQKMREAITDVLEYAEAVNAEVQNIAGFCPFGNMKGFKGRGESLDKKTTRWLLKGLGFTLS